MILKTIIDNFIKEKIMICIDKEDLENEIVGWIVSEYGQQVDPTELVEGARIFVSILEHKQEIPENVRG